MMKKRLSILLSCLVATSVAMAVIPDMKFRRLDTRNGLSHSQVNCVLKDSRGFVWLGTPYGLNRYDGYRVKTFYSNIRDTTSMRDNYVDQIYEAYDGKLWLKQGMNYCVYDPVTERFERNAGRELAQFGINGGVERLYIDSHKNFWVKLYEAGLFYYNPYTKRLHEFKLGYDNQEFPPNFGISSFADCGSSVVVASNCGEMICLNGEQGRISWTSKWMRRHGGLENREYNVYIDRHANLWVTTLEYTFIYIQKERRWYRSVPQYLKAHGITDIPSPLNVWDVCVDKHGRLWVATDHEGLFVVDVKGRQIRQFLNSRYDETTISDNTPKHLYLSSGGQMWIGTYKNGANQYRESLSDFHTLEVGDVNAVTEDHHGNYWIGTNDRGIIVYDPRTGEQTHYTTDNSGLSSNIMVGSFTASDGSIWFGSYNGGLVRCIPSAADPHMATIVNYRATDDPDGLSNNNVWSVTEDRWHRIWIGTLGGGIQRLDLKTGKFRTWSTKNTKLPSDYMTTVNWTRRGWLMVGTTYYYALVNPQSGKLLPRTIPEDPAITVTTSNTTAVMEDSRELIWQGSTSGVTVYDPKTGSVALLDMTKGLYGSSICSVTEDKTHAMWVVTDHGVSRVIPQKQPDGTWQFIVRSYNTGDGLQSGTYNQRSACCTRDGLILVGGQSGVDVIDPRRIASAKGHERPVFSGLQIFDRDVVVGQETDGRVILDEALNVCRRISLRYNDQFTIQLASNAGNINNQKRFVYVLDGFNEDWVKTSELNPNIVYNSLRAGSYVLRVRMLNDDGTIGTEESQLDITILPPLWRTRWMILFYMLLIAVAALLWRRWFLRRQTKRMQVETVRRELEKQQWMNEMRLQLAKEQTGEMERPVMAEQKVESDLQRADLVGFVRQQCDSYVSPVTDKRVKVTFLTSVDRMDVDFDSAQMAEILHILFRNAATFSPSDCNISVGVARTAEGKAHLQVADNGIGIQDKYKEHAFDPIVNGEGIGLDKVKAIVTAHGGDIRIEDNPGGGTVFVITLPAPEEEVIEEAVLMDEE